MLLPHVKLWNQQELAPLLPPISALKLSLKECLTIFSFKHFLVHATPKSPLNESCCKLSPFLAEESFCQSFGCNLVQASSK
jgi:hypothetical protein